jgi:serine phosphatase RsbU (regulator of sigma subunit)
MQAPPQPWFELGAAARALRDAEISGDAWRGWAEGGCFTLAVIDGVGHGLAANVAAVRAIAAIDRDLSATPLAPLDALMSGCHRELHGTRGAAVSLCRFDPQAGKVSYCGIGNTSFRRHPARSSPGVSLPGVVGYMLRNIRVFEADMLPDDFFCVHTDGLTDAFPLSGYLRLGAQQAADRALQEHRKTTDDATVVMLRVLTG